MGLTGEDANWGIKTKLKKKCGKPQIVGSARVKVWCVKWTSVETFAKALNRILFLGEADGGTRRSLERTAQEFIL